MKRIYIDNSDLIELISEITDKIVKATIGESATIIDEEKGIEIYTDEAQDLFNSTYDEIEELFDTTCGIISDINKVE